MIRTKTVFVLGAGARAPFGYPLGQQLREQLIEELSVGAPEVKPAGVILRELGFEKDAIQSFRSWLLSVGLKAATDVLES